MGPTLTLTLPLILTGFCVLHAALGVSRGARGPTLAPVRVSFSG